MKEVRTLRNRLTFVMPAVICIAVLAFYFLFIPDNIFASKASSAAIQNIGKSVNDAIDTLREASAPKKSQNEGTNNSSTEKSGTVPSDGGHTDPNHYTVKKGEALAGIAGKLKTTASELRWANNLKSDSVVQGQVLAIPQKQDKPLKTVISEKGIDTSENAIRIVVDKSDKVLGVFAQDQFLKAYHVEMGDTGIGDKEIEGDHKTPEGDFYITERYAINPGDEYLGSRWMRLSYPNIEAAQRGLAEGLIDRSVYNDIVNAINNGGTPPQETPLGGAIGIHGGSRAELGSNWTWGCVGLADKDVEDLYSFIHIGTQVLIRK
jgi:LysM repeat protein